MCVPATVNRGVSLAVADSSDIGGRATSVLPSLGSEFKGYFVRG